MASNAKAGEYFGCVQAVCGLMQNFKLLVGYLLAFAIGVICRWIDIPLPAPTALLGAFIVLSLTSGYLVTDWWLSRSGGKGDIDA